MTVFAKDTEVSVERSRAEIERLIIRYGATSTAFMTEPGRAMILFECQARRVLFALNLPRQDADEFKRSRRGVRSPEQRIAAWEQSCRQKWRALTLVIKAKLEAVASGITTFEDEFLAHIVMPDGQTVADHIKPRIDAAYKEGKMLALMPPRKGTP